MCSSTDTNKWAPRLVIILQLATWSVVGIVLLQRGATSLRPKLEERKTTAQIQVVTIGESDAECEDDPETEGDDGSRQRNRADSFLQKDSISNSQRNMLELPSEYSLDKEHASKDLKVLPEEHAGKITKPCAAGNSNTDSDNMSMSKNLRKKMRTTRARERVIHDQLLEAGKGRTNSLKQDLLIEDYDFGSAPLDPDSSIESHEEASSMDQSNDTVSLRPTPNGIHEGIASSSHGEAPRLKPVDRAGAAAAVAMLAIGVVMLLLGPAIVILRTIEARRRERRLPKSRARKDLPPTYEEATLMDEAPRYSSLYLNTLNECSPDTALTNPSTSS